ncbi:MAG: non-reducing end alpha-L-arabinofuranosidase family hydrolase [Pirellulaceae bacterium]
MKRSDQITRPLRLIGLIWLGLATVSAVWAQESGGIEEANFRWITGPPVVAPRSSEGLTCYSIKDPSIVRYQDRWHLYCTIRGKPRSHAIVYLTFRDWSEADQAPRSLLKIHPGFYCAPQVFYFEPHKKWYLICQAAREDWEPDYQPAFATSDDLTDPDAWSTLRPLFEPPATTVRAWLDFWVICDDAKAHLFFTSLDGRMWRSETTLARFPHGWAEPVVSIQGDIFEASHTYRLKGRDEYLTLVEAQDGFGWRYYKAYLAEQLEGPWRPLAADKDRAFASMQNVQQPTPRWTDSISHGELLRDGFDQRLEVDPADLQFLFQGVLDSDRAGKPYGEIPWRLGVLREMTKDK